MTMDEKDLGRVVRDAARVAYAKCGMPWTTSAEDLEQEGWVWVLNYMKGKEYSIGSLFFYLTQHLQSVAKREGRHDKAGTYLELVEGEFVDA